MTDVDSLALLAQLKESLRKENSEHPGLPQVSPHDVCAGIASVINFIITDAFNLTEEENMWVSYHLKSILEPVSILRPRVLLAAVKQELESKEYSDKLFNRNWATSGYAQVEAHVRYAPLEDWVESLSEIILVSYPDLRPLIKSSIIGSILGVMAELGVSDDIRESRGSMYLPTAVRRLVGLS